MSLRIVFMGTPAFAVPALEGLLSAGYEIVMVMAQPDRPAGRGRQPTPPPVAAFARERGLPLFQPPSLKPPEAFARVREATPDVIVVAAYGLILRREVLELPRLGCVNLHASLLPRHRGAAPINAAILAGDAETGICLMQMEVGLDTGPVYARRSTPISPEDDTPILTERLAQIGRDLLVETLPRLAAGEITPEPQDDALATYAPKIQREDARLDWSLPALDLWRRVRAYRGWPDAFTTWQGKGLKVLAARPLTPQPPLPHHTNGEAPPLPRTTEPLRFAASPCRGIPASGEGEMLPGRVVLVSDGGQQRPAVVTGDGLLVLDTVMLEGKRPVAGADFARGYRAFVGSELGA
ncbi:MAG: methionyl-tRNA formyltransferase [Chloroflexota bacterium]